MFLNTKYYWNLKMVYIWNNTDEKASPGTSIIYLHSIRRWNNWWWSLNSSEYPKSLQESKQTQKVRDKIAFLNDLLLRVKQLAPLMRYVWDIHWPVGLIEVIRNLLNIVRLSSKFLVPFTSLTTGFGLENVARHFFSLLALDLNLEVVG